MVGIIGGHRNYGIETAFGAVTGHTRISGVGSNPDVDTGTLPEDVWDGGGLYPFLTASTALEIVSSDVNDSAAGTGARTVSVAGLNSSYVPVNQTLTLNGTTPVAIPTALFRIQNIRISSAGTGKVNAGTITVQDAGAGTTRGLILAGNGISRSSFITVPAGFSLVMGPWAFSISRSVATGYASIASYIGDPSGFFRLGFEIGISTDSPYLHNDSTLGMPIIVIAEKNDFGFRCTSVTANNTRINAAWQGIFRANGLA